MSADLRAAPRGAGDVPRRPAVVVVGAASRDVVADDTRGWRLGGAVTYAALTLARLGLRVRAVVGVDAEAATARELDVLRQADVEIALAPLEHGPVFENIEQRGGRRQRCLSAADAIEPSALPQRWRSTDALFLGPVAGELPSGWASVGAPFVALGWQGLLRRVVAGADVERLAPRPDPLLAEADLVGMSADDVDSRVRLSELVDLIKPGATLAVSRGDRGGTVLVSRRPARSLLRAYPAIPSNDVVDPTGAGDVFLAALVAATVDSERLGARDLGARLTFAAAAASLAVERPGIDGVPKVGAVRRRMDEVA